MATYSDAVARSEKLYGIEVQTEWHVRISDEISTKLTMSVGGERVMYKEKIDKRHVPKDVWAEWKEGLDALDM